MNVLSHRSNGLAITVVLCLYVQQAEGAFLNVRVDMHAAEIAADDPFGATSAPVETPPEPDCSPARLLMELGLSPVPMDGSGGMGSSRTGNAPGPATPVSGEAHDCSAGQIVTYLAAESDLLLPIPFLEGVFRPPRA